MTLKTLATHYRFKVVLAVVLLGFGVSYSYWLPWIAMPVVCCQTAPRPVDIVVANGYGAMDFATDMAQRRQYDHFLLVQSAPNRTVAIGVADDPLVVSKRNLLRRGIAEERIEVIPGSARNRWEAARQLQAWLRRNPTRRVHILCDEWGSKSERVMLDRTLEAGVAARITVQGVPDPRYDTSTWWRSRRSLHAMYAGYVSLFYTMAVGEPEHLPAYLSADEYAFRFLNEARSKFGGEPTRRSGRIGDLKQADIQSAESSK